MAMALAPWMVKEGTSGTMPPNTSKGLVTEKASFSVIPGTCSLFDSDSREAPSLQDPHPGSHSYQISDISENMVVVWYFAIRVRICSFRA